MAYVGYASPRDPQDEHAQVHREEKMYTAIFRRLWLAFRVPASMSAAVFWPVATEKMVSPDSSTYGVKEFPDCLPSTLI